MHGLCAVEKNGEVVCRICLIRGLCGVDILLSKGKILIQETFLAQTYVLYSLYYNSVWP